MTIRDLDLLWKVLENETRDPGVGKYLDVGASTATGEVLVSVDESGARVILLPTSPDEPFAPDTSTKVHITRRLLRTSRGDQTFVAVTCQADQVKAAFTTMASQMISASEGSAGPGSVVSRLLNEWRDLLSGNQPSVLTDQKLVGVAAELLTLLKVLPSDPERDISVWKGPGNTVHDIQRGKSALEVKGTLSREALIVQIHGLRQLESPADGTLHLVVYRFEESSDNTAFSIPDLVRAVVDLGVSKPEFVRRLERVGYYLAAEDFYSDFRIKTTELRVYAVNDQFPRIVRDSFIEGDAPLGVLSMRYSVDLTGPSPSPLASEAAEEVIKLSESDS